MFLFMLIIYYMFVYATVWVCACVVQCVGLFFTVLPVYVLYCAASGVIKNDDEGVRDAASGAVGGALGGRVWRDWSMLRPVEESALFGEPGQNYESNNTRELYVNRHYLVAV